LFGAKRFGKEKFERAGFRGGRRGGQQFAPMPQAPAAGAEQERHGPESHGEPARKSRLVVPGELLGAAGRPIPHTFTENGSAYSNVVGLFDDASGKLIPLEGVYTPALDDVVVGVVVAVRFAGFTLDLKSPYEGFISGKDTRDVFKLGEVLVSRVKEVDEVRNVDLTEASKLEGGEIIEIPSVKVPRVIGKNSSMIRMLQDATKSEIVVGKNGRIWVKGGNSALAIEAILKIEREAHTQGLTDRISALLGSGGQSRGV